jgi:hypothetical protein
MKRRVAVPDRGHVHKRRGASTSWHIHVFTGGGLGGIIPGIPPSSSANMTANADRSAPGRRRAQPHLYVQAGHGAPDSTYDSTARAKLLTVRTPRKNK